MWLQIVLLIVSMAISYATRPKPQNAKPAGINEINITTAEDGREIPWLFGTRDMEGPNCVWYGDLRTKPIKKKA